MILAAALWMLKARTATQHKVDGSFRELLESKMVTMFLDPSDCQDVVSLLPNQGGLEIVGLDRKT